jgi:tetratricopeptide (TPR) repeat protein
MSLAFLFFPSFSELIPGMNLLYSSFGHNHIGALLIIFIPVASFYLIKFWQKKEKQNFALMFGLLILFLVNLLASFGRLVIFIGLLEIITLGLINYKNFISQKRIFKYFYSFFVFSFLVVLLVKLIISSLLFLKPGFSCKFPLFSSYENKICKDISQEARRHYWQRAISSISENWKVGYGPGTYSLINNKYKDIPGGNSAYAHNAYLQVFAENGIFFFSIFIWLMSMSWILSAKVAMPKLSLKKVLTGQNDLSLSQALFIGVSAIYLDVLFDFDWSFLGIFMVTLLFIVMILRDQKVKRIKKTSKKNPVFSSVIKFSYVLVSLSLILFSLISIKVESLIYLGKTNQAVNFFPYFQIHMKLFLNDESLNEESAKVLNKVYKNHSSYYLFNDQEEVLIKYLDQVIKIDPWYYYSYNALANLYDDQPEVVEKELVRVKALYDKSKKRGDQGSYAINNDLAKLSSRIGDEYLKNRNIDKAAYFYLLGFEFDNWLWNKTVPAFVYFPLTNEEKIELWQYLESIDVIFFAKNKGNIAESYFSFADQYLEENDVKNFVEIIKRIEQIAPWVADKYVGDNDHQIQLFIDQMIEENRSEEAISLLEVLSKTNYSYWAKTQLGNYYLMTGEINKAKESFEKCQIDWEIDSNGLRHDDCYYAIHTIDNDSFNKDTYQSVSSSIIKNRD